MDGPLPSCISLGPEGEGVDRERGLLLCIEDIDLDGATTKEVRARLRLPSIFCDQVSKDLMIDNFVVLV